MGLNLHKTSIRNENAYFCCITQLLEYSVPPSSSPSISALLSSTKSPHLNTSLQHLHFLSHPLAFGKHFPLSPSLSLPPIFVVGDSHTLTYSWQEVTVKGERKVLVPCLVTGLKVFTFFPFLFFILFSLMTLFSLFSRSGTFEEKVTFIPRPTFLRV